MNLIVVDTYEDMSRAAADVIAACVNEKPDCVLGRRGFDGDGQGHQGLGGRDVQA